MKGQATTWGKGQVGVGLYWGAEPGQHERTGRKVRVHIELCTILNKHHQFILG